MSTTSTLAGSAPPSVSDLSILPTVTLLPLNAVALVRFLFNIQVSIIRVSQTDLHNFTDGYSFLRYLKSSVTELIKLFELMLQEFTSFYFVSA